jgi:hypothetical protein
MDLEQGADTLDIHTPGLFGLSRHFDGSIGIILFMRHNIETIMRDRDNKYITGAFDQFARLERLINSHQPERILGPFAAVGTLPGIIKKREKSLSEK